LSEKHDPNHRRVIYDIFVKAVDDMQAKEDKERLEAEEEDDDD
jgi:hypothetical protein